MSKNNQSTSLVTSESQKGLAKWLTIFKKRPILLFLSFWAITLLLYLPTMQAGFVTDVTSGIEKIIGQPFWRIIHSFGFPALNQLSILGFYLMYQIFGTNGLPWYLLFCGLHALNAFLGYRFFGLVFTSFKIKNSVPIVFLGVLCFLLHPYQSEVLVWRACLNYLLITTFILLQLTHLWQYLQTKKTIYLFYLHGFFVGAIFTFELALILPFLTICYYSIWSWYTEDLQQLKPYFLKISVPHFFLILAYFLLNKIVIGTWIGHYGADTHLKFSLTEMCGTLLQYTVKYSFFVRSFPHAYKEAIFSFFGQYGLFILGVFLVGLFFYLKRKIATSRYKIAVGGMLGLGFIFALFPVLNLFFYWLLYVENDRYGYLASLFGMLLIVFLVFQLPKIIRTVLLIIYLGLSIFLTIQTNQHWKASTDVFYSLLDNYRWQNAANVVILNVPDNYNGAYMFRIIGKKSGFKDALTTIHQQKIKGEIWEVAQYNMVLPSDGVRVQQTKPHQLKVTFNQWGNWFWRNGVGVGPTHEREWYTAHFKGQYYLLDFTNLPDNTVFIYQDGKEWKEVSNGE